MGSKRHKTHHHHTSNISGQNPKFFKIILQDTIQDARLAIPRKFVKEHRDCLSSRITIKVSDGTLWKMELLMGHNYEAWLQQGWKEFEEYYSLQHGFLLLFKYEDGSNFHVIIFDTTLLEIEYPKKPDSSTNLDKNPSFIPNLDKNPSFFSSDLDENPSFIPNLDQNPSFIPKLDKNPSFSSPDLDKNRSFISDLEQNPSSGPKLDGFITVDDSDEENLDIEGVSGKSEGKRISRALETADKFSSTNPWFKVVLKSTRGRLFSLCMPIGFIREHIDCNLETVILKVEGGKCRWPTTLNLYLKKSSARLSAGWSAFVKDNHLKDKDVCVFELVAKNELKVHIFRHPPLRA
ncbi:B3 domain-containing protein Os11g0197600 [Euphorbia peplus]|nr:B3 domain-containing protein Os11g0197600 [Euphorbia peplus]